MSCGSRRKKVLPKFRSPRLTGRGWFRITIRRKARHEQEHPADGRCRLQRERRRERTDLRCARSGAGLCRQGAIRRRIRTARRDRPRDRSEEHTSELQSLMRISYAVFCLKKKKNNHKKKNKKQDTNIT